MNRSAFVSLAFGLWALSFLLSFWMLWHTPAMGDGFTRGLNRIAAFLGWQFIALILAVAAWVAAWPMRQEPGMGRARWLGRIPILAESLLVVFVGGLFVYFSYFGPTAEPPAVYRKPTTEAVDLPQTSSSVAADVDAAIPQPESPVGATEWRGVFRSGFEQSHFYPLDGSGPIWVRPSEEASAVLAAHVTKRSGRDTGVAAIVEFVGRMEDGGGFGHLGRYERQLVLESVSEIQAIPDSMFEDLVQSAKPPASSQSP